MSDQQIECVECGRSFIWSDGEQRFYAERGFQPPKHCPDCRAHRRAEQQTGMAPFLPVEPLPIPKELRAAADRLSGRERPPSRPARGVSRTGKLVYRWLGGAFGLALLVTVALSFIGLDVVLAWLIVMTVITFSIYGYDKFIAGSAATRVPEKVLLALAWIGGILGALVGMKVFRHKTAKESFQARLVVALVVQIVVVIVYFYFFV
jgi:uncharacterized membrane protein YsdA (DUF1294 family)